MISGLPGLTRDAWRASLAEAVAFSPDHVSVYDLQIEEGTPFGKWYEPGVGPMPREEDGGVAYSLDGVTWESGVKLLSYRSSGLRLVGTVPSRR